MQTIFDTPRLILREFMEEDAALILDLNSDPEVVKYVHEPVLKNVEEAKKILTEIILPQYKNKLGRWAIFTKSDNEFIGWSGLKHRADMDEIDLGYRLKRSFWGKGFATEAAKYTLDFGFKNLHLPLITARAHVQNIASLTVLQKIGMRFICEEIVDDCPVKTFTISNSNKNFQ